MALQPRSGVVSRGLSGIVQGRRIPIVSGGSGKPILSGKPRPIVNRPVQFGASVPYTGKTFAGHIVNGLFK